MKKLLAVASALALTVSAVSPAVLAAETLATQQTETSARENMQKILESVKQRVEIPSECSEFSSRTEEQYGEKVYNFTWNEKDGNKSVNITCTADGVITNYSIHGFKSDDKNNTPNLPKISESDAKKTAENFLKQINPDFPYEIKIYGSNGSIFGNGYTLYIKTYLNGVLFTNGNGSVNIDGTDGYVMGFDLGYIQADFPSINNAISVDEAKKAYSDKLGLELVYRTYVDEDGNVVAYPVYTQEYDYDKYINALTGDAVDVTNYRYFIGNKSESANDAAADGGLTEQEIKELDNIDGLISRTALENKLKSNKLLSIPKNINTDSISLYKNYDDEYTYSVSMSNDKCNIYTSVDAKTGEIKYYSRWGEDDSKEKNNDDSALKTLAGDKAKEYKYDENSHLYVRYVNGIKVTGDYANVTTNNGVLTNFSMNYTDTEFPSIENAMSKEDAEKILFDAKDYSIVYMQNYTDNTREIIPVYTIDTENINPFTGKFVDYQNKEITEDASSKLEYSDIDGHYAEKYIKELAYYGIGFEGGEFKPDEKITQKDFLALLMSINGNDIIVLKNNLEQANWVYRNSTQNSIISEDERDDDAEVTREEAAVYMIRAIGAENYAKYNDIYVTPFNDVTENKGYIALLSAMGVLSGDGNGNFNPNREMTRAESIIMIYNYLTR